MRFPIRSTLAVFALLAAVHPWTAHGDTLVTPTGLNLENVDGPQAFAFPWARGNPEFSNFPYRYQQGYAASEFDSIGDVLQISELRFRVDQATGSRTPFNVGDVEVRLSVTTVDPDELATGSTEALDGNIGARQTLVYEGPLAWDPCDVAVCPVPAFDLAVPFVTDFVYDPLTDGNLLLEVYNLSEVYPTQFFDAVNTPADGIGHVREVLDRNDVANHLFPTDAPSNGLVTQFVYTVPEAGSAASAAAALLAVAALRRRRA
ncbi:MAG: hypothetical protein DCC71_23920 [Proteobacteria bacterium]|nr:MAG: hypothetical protein DCC71_23920 [Pseudomonadota bacterium]